MAPGVFGVHNRTAPCRVGKNSASLRGRGRGGAQVSQDDDTWTWAADGRENIFRLGWFSGGSRGGRFFAVFCCFFSSFWAGVRMPSPCPRLDPVSVRASDTRRCERNLEWGGVTSDGEKAQGGPRIGAEMSDNFEPQSTP